MTHRPLSAAVIALLILVPSIPRGADAQEPPPFTNLFVDAAVNRHPINPNIYGVNDATAGEMTDLNFTLNRRSGARISRYNWELNADNRGSDFYFESHPYESAEPGAEIDAFVGATKSAGAEPFVTVPAIGIVAKVGPEREPLASFSVARYGSQIRTDPAWPDAGNGVSSATGAFIEDNNPGDANTGGGIDFQQRFVQHLAGTWGTADAGGVRYYGLDNEPSLWHLTHRDVSPVGMGMERTRDMIVSHAAMIRSVDPAAVIIGPEEAGWDSYFLSGEDQQWAARNNQSWFPDREAHGNADYLPWLLADLWQNDLAAGQRSLDVFSVHYYPQGGEYAPATADVSTAMQLRRNRSTRALWDPNYLDESWIDDTVRLIPRLKGWVDTSYPGLQVGLTEYSWGADDHINGATAQADLLGIFGREGLDMALRRSAPAPSTPTYKAMKLYRNYDGNRSTFGDVSVSAITPNSDVVSMFAAERSADGALTIAIVSKLPGRGTRHRVFLDNFGGGPTAEVYQLTATNEIARLADTAVHEGSVYLFVPGQSVTLLVIPPGAPLPTVTVTTPNGGERYRLNTFVHFSWNVAGEGVTSWEIRLSSDGGATFPLLVGAAPVPEKTSFHWRIPTSVPRGQRFRLQVILYTASGYRARDVSDADFSILKQRN